MSDIALVIKISEEKYNRIINRYQGSNVRPKDYEIAIINGIPLDNIRADVEKECEPCEYEEDFVYNDGLLKAIEIIDKYRVDGESEDKR